MDSNSTNSGDSSGASGGDPPVQQVLGEASPLRLGTGSNVPSPPRTIRPLAVVPPVMGVPGVSAFSPYVRPPPPPPPPARSEAPPTTGAGGFPGLAPFTFFNRAPPPPSRTDTPPTTSVGGFPGLAPFTFFNRAPQPPSRTEAPPTTSAGGFPGLAPFTFFNRAPPLPHWYPGGAGPSSGPSGLGFGYGYGVFGGHLLPRGGSGYGAGLRIGGNQGPGAKKRFREDGGASGSGKQPAGVRRLYPCTLCDKVFTSEKALFGHMRSHPDRGWKGVHPPPAFRAALEFADVPGLNLPEEMEAADVEEGEIVAAAEDGGDVEMQPQGAAAEEEEENYAVPDLNRPPPPSPDQ